MFEKNAAMQHGGIGIANFRPLGGHEKIMLFLFSLAGLINLDYVFDTEGLRPFGAVAVAVVLVLLSFRFAEVFKGVGFLTCVAIISIYLVIYSEYFALYFSFYYIYWMFGYFFGKTAGALDVERLAIALLIAFVALMFGLFVIGGPVLDSENDVTGVRLASTIGGAPSTSFFAVMLFCVLLSTGRRAWAALALLLLALTASRGAMLAAAVDVLVWFFVFNKYHRLPVLAIMMLVLMVSLPFAEDVLITFRVLDLNGNINLGTFLGRVVVWIWGWEYFWDAEFLKQIFGHGTNRTKEIFFLFNTFKGEASGAGALHNEYLRVLIENGVAGIVIVLVLMGGLLIKAARAPVVSSYKSVAALLVISIAVLASVENVFYAYDSYMFFSAFFIGYCLNHSGEERAFLAAEARRSLR